jgi:predicted transcriptional regulator
MIAVMNRPKSQIESDANIGPVDESGQQIWSAEEEAAIARLHRDPAYWAAIEEAEADIEAGRVFTHDEVLAASAERRRRYLAERKR